MHTWLRDVTEKIESAFPQVWSTCYPRHILVPPGYISPKYYSAAILGHLKMLDSVGPASPEAHVMVALSSLNLARFKVPTYFVEKEFAEAVAHIRLPDGLRFGDLTWPLDALLFVLPEAFCRQHFGWHTPFLALNRIRQGQHPDVADAPLLRAVQTNPMHLRPMLAPTTRFSMAASLIPDDGTTPPVDYTASYPVNLGLDVLEEAPFSDATAMEYADWGVRPPPSQGRMPNADEDKALTRSLIEFSVKLLLALAARPVLLRNGTLARPAKVKKGRVRTELWNPSMVGTGYRVHRPPNVPAGSHAKPRMHWRWGHYTHQAIGRRGDPGFVSVNDLPREDGKIAWHKVPEATREAFWKCHKLVMIDPILVNAPAPESHVCIQNG